MGSWFSNLHIRKNGTLTLSDVKNHMAQIMSAQQFIPAASEAEADGAVAIVSSNDSQWFSVYSDLFCFENPATCGKLAKPISTALRSDVLGIACFDSDYLYLNLINHEDKTDAWAGVGSAAGLGIKRRTSLSAWKEKVADFQRFKKCVKTKYVCAEEVLGEIAPCLELPELQSMASYEYLMDFDFSADAVYLFFKLPDSMKSKEPPRLVPLMYSLMPCELEQPGLVDAVNTGRASKGLTVFFVGDYVEHDEITFSDVCWAKWKNEVIEETPIKLSKGQLTDGRWVYYYHDPGLRIPTKADERLPWSRQMERSIMVRFVPHGNPRKILDITVVLVPDDNPAGQTVWNVWHQFGSKAAFIKQHNENWSKIKGQERLLLREEDFD